MHAQKTVNSKIQSYDCAEKGCINSIIRNMEAESMNVLVLGGGIGGIVATNVLSRKLGREHEIMLVDKKTEHRFSPSLSLGS